VEAWMSELLAGYVSSADTGHEDLVIASRAALSDFCEESIVNLSLVCNRLAVNLKTCQGQDRIIVPTLEILAFLFHVDLFQECLDVDLRNLCLQVQKSAYKTGNVRKLEACIRVYGGIASLEGSAEVARVADDLSSKRWEGIAEAKKRLGALMFHPWPRVRSFVVDELWVLLADDEKVAMRLTGVDWGKAEKGVVQTMIDDLGLG
jgi:tubulin-specific chaperone D